MKYEVKSVTVGGLVYAVDMYGITKIEEHRSMGEGDRWYYDVYYDHGIKKRHFTFEEVVFQEKECSN